VRRRYYRQQLQLAPDQSHENGSLAASPLRLRIRSARPLASVTTNVDLSFRRMSAGTTGPRLTTGRTCSLRATSGTFASAAHVLFRLEYGALAAKQVRELLEQRWTPAGVHLPQQPWDSGDPNVAPKPEPVDVDRSSAACAAALPGVAIGRRFLL
jgi:hypothetical protein